MSVYKVLTGNKEITLDQNLELEVGLNQVQRNDETVRQLREDHAKYFTNEDYWNLLRTAIALNVDCTITKYQYADINGDREKCETKNKTDKAFIEFLYRLKSPISIEREHYLEDPTQYKQFPFDSKRKRMTTFITSAEFPSNYRLFSKGGGENSSKFCN